MGFCRRLSVRFRPRSSEIFAAARFFGPNRTGKRVQNPILRHTDGRRRHCGPICLVARPGVVHFLSAMFGSLMFWPVLTALLLWLAGANSAALADLFGFDWRTVFGTTSLDHALAVIVFALATFPVYWFSGRVVSKFWDDWADLKRAVVRMRVGGAQRQNIRGALATLHTEMDKIAL